MLHSQQRFMLVKLFKTTIAAIEKLLQIEGRIETQRKYYIRYVFKKPQGL